MTRQSLIVVAAIAALNSGALGQAATVRITGGAQALTVAAADLHAMPRLRVTASSHGQTATYEGVSMRELLTKAGIAAGEDLRGRELTSVVIVSGADGYRVAFALAEFDPSFTDRVALLADTKNGEALSGNDAPFQLVLPDEKRPSRWVRQVISIELVKP